MPDSLLITGFEAAALAELAVVPARYLTRAHNAAGMCTDELAAIGFKGAAQRR